MGLCVISDRREERGKIAGNYEAVANGDIVMWIDAGNLHLKCVAKCGDPVESNAEELVELLEELQKCMQWVARP